MKNPENLRYTREHEWVRLDGDTAYIGITDHAQDSLGDIVYVELPETGREIGAGDEASNIESVKAAAPVYSPVSGTVVEINSELDPTPELINQKPYETFIFAVKMTDPGQADALMSRQDYESFLAEEEST